MEAMSLMMYRDLARGLRLWCAAAALSPPAGLAFGLAFSYAQTAQSPEIAGVCAPCHGFDGIGHDVEVPNIAGQHSIYLRNQLIAFRKRQRRHTEMTFLSRDLTDREIDQLVTFYSTLPPR